MLLQLQDRYEEIERRGGGVLGVSGAASHQARWLTEKKGIQYPLLLDPDRSFKEALGVGRMPWRTYLLPTTWWRYLKGAFRSRQGAVTASPTELPAVAIIDTDGQVRYRHVGSTLGDYPSVDLVLDELAKVTGRG